MICLFLDYLLEKWICCIMYFIVILKKVNDIKRFKVLDIFILNLSNLLWYKNNIGKFINIMNIYSGIFYLIRYFVLKFKFFIFKFFFYYIIFKGSIYIIYELFICFILCNLLNWVNFLFFLFLINIFKMNYMFVIFEELMKNVKKKVYFCCFGWVWLYFKFFYSVVYGVLIDFDVFKGCLLVWVIKYFL